jgi:hypothetical protein
LLVKGAKPKLNMAFPGVFFPKAGHTARSAWAHTAHTQLQPAAAVSVCIGRPYK